MKFVIATQNKGKLVEFKRLLEPMGIEAVTMDIEEPEETGTTFEENAFIKAQAACQETGLPAVADDSGLCVDYLGGAPGIFSARFAEPGKRWKSWKGCPRNSGGPTLSARCAVCSLMATGLTPLASALGRSRRSPGGRMALGMIPSFCRGI